MFFVYFFFAGYGRRAGAEPSAAAAAASHLYDASFGFNATHAGWEPNASFWQSALAIEALLEVIDSGATTALEDQINATLVDAMRVRTSAQVLGEISTAYDDLLWWCGTFLSLAEHSDTAASSALWLHRARDVFDYVFLHAWDNKQCGGGLFWSAARAYKNSIVNTLALDAAVRLSAAVAGDSGSVYATQAELIFAWLVHSQLINTSTFEVYDGLNMSTCSPPPPHQRAQWSYNAGVAIEALAGYGTDFNDAAAMSLALGIANASIYTFTVVDDNTIRLIVELNGVHDRDQQVFKGIYARSLARLAVRVRGGSDRRLRKFADQIEILLTNSAELVFTERGRNGLYQSDWRAAPFSTKAVNFCGSSPGIDDAQFRFPPVHQLAWRSCVGPTPQMEAVMLFNAASEVLTG